MIDKELHEQTVNKLTKALGEYIYSIRKKKNITVRELNKMTKVSIGVISDLENHRSMPRIETILRLMMALDIPLNEIFSCKFDNCNKEYTGRNYEQVVKVLLDEGTTKEETSEVIGFIKFKRFLRGL